MNPKACLALWCSNPVRAARAEAPSIGPAVFPTTFQGVPLRGSGDPILNLASPKGVSAESQRDSLDLKALNLKRLMETGDEEIRTRIASYEMSYQMQSSAPELIDISGETQATLELYGLRQASFANNCLLARRLVERGTRFVQLYHTNWDHHGGPGETLTKDLEKVTHDVDQGCVALIRDPKSRGLLDDTLVIWGGEFGRTPMSEVRKTPGRNHHIDAFSMWFAGGGVKPGNIVGETDEFGFDSVGRECHVHDLHATILHLLGMNHEQLTFRFQGRDFRLTDVAGHVIEPSSPNGGLARTNWGRNSQTHPSSQPNLDSRFWRRGFHGARPPRSNKPPRQIDGGWSLAISITACEDGLPQRMSNWWNGFARPINFLSIPLNGSRTQRRSRNTALKCIAREARYDFLKIYRT